MENSVGCLNSTWYYFQLETLLNYRIVLETVCGKKVLIQSGESPSWLIETVRVIF